jgi:hypothetical protein
MLPKCLFLVVAATLASGVGTVYFTDVTTFLKVTFKHESSPTSNKYLLETMGGGVALFDYDNDGRLDIFFTNGALIRDPMAKAALPDKLDPRYWNRLYHQGSDGTFIDVTEHANLTGMAQNRYGTGVATGDYDNDGFVDLYVAGYGGNTLYRNNGDGTFKDVTAQSGTGAGGWSTSVGFFDYDNDGKLDLFVARYLDWTFDKNRYCGAARPGGRAYCHPDSFDRVSNLLYRNNGDGTFAEVGQNAGIANTKGKGLGVAFADFNEDGWLDVFVANDSVQCFLYRNNRNGTFTDVSLTAGVGFNEDGKTFAGMGVDFSDFDNDGRPDIIVTDLSDERYVLFRNNGDSSFTDATTTSGIGRATQLFSGWSTRFVDYDNDGWKDLFVAQGHVMDTIEATSRHLKYMQPPLLLKNITGKFLAVDGGPDLRRPWAGRAAAFGDLDNDGDVDIVVANTGQSAYILRNEGGNRNGWIGIETTGTRSNRDGIGCRVKVTSSSGPVQYSAVATTIGYQSASDRRLIVGLGADKAAREVVIQWPSGVNQRFENVTSGTVIHAKESPRP